jgi:hypothetical protein
MNILQSALQKAAVNPAFRSEFYKVFMNSEIFIIGKASCIENGVAKPGSEMSIPSFQTNDFTYIAVFSSLEELQKSLSSESSYLKIKCLDFLELVGPQNIILNPGLEYGKHFTPNEITRILDKTIFSGSESYTVEKPTNVLLGQPSNYPNELIKIASEVCSMNKAIHKAYLIHFFNPTKDTTPHSLIAVEADGVNRNSIVSSIGIAVQEYSSKNNDPVDIYLLTNNTGSIEEYCKRIKPFYKKKFLGLF